MTTNNKYHAQRTRLDGHTFDSKAEANRFAELKLLERAGIISDLAVHPVFFLQDEFTDRQGRKHRAVTYEADFRYTDEDGIDVVEDVKARGKVTQTAAFRIKWKLAIRKYPDIKFQVVES